MNNIFCSTGFNNTVGKGIVYVNLNSLDKIRHKPIACYVIHASPTKNALKRTNSRTKYMRITTFYTSCSFFFFFFLGGEVGGGGCKKRWFNHILNLQKAVLSGSTLFNFFPFH